MTGVERQTRGGRGTKASALIRVAASLVGFTALPSALGARDYPIAFDATAPVDTTQTTAVWNLSLQQIQLPLIVDRSSGATPGEEDDVVDIGGAADGSFGPARYAALDLRHGADPTRVTLDTSRAYEFTDFNLVAGVTLSGSGPLPLRLYVQGDVTVAGVIDVSGQPGDEASVGGLATGGAGGSGGQPGGTGGLSGSNFAPTAGGSASGTGGGGGGVNSVAGGSGGGGAGYFTSGFAGANGGGAAGSAYTDIYLTAAWGALALPFGGSGGGGGGADTSAANISGGGGGGGGGAVVLNAGGNVHVLSTGRILAIGGNGGTAQTTAGPGGGGSGGSIRIFCGGTLVDDGEMHAEQGNGGGVAAGGGGSLGITRLVSGTGTLTGGGSETPAPVVSPLGQTFFTQRPKQLISRPIDSGNSAPNYLAVSKTGVFPAGTSAVYEYGGSADGFVNDDTGFVPEAQLSKLNGRRYFRFRVTLQTTSPAVSPRLAQMVFQLDDYVQGKFVLHQAGCARVEAGEGSSARGEWWIFIAYLLCLPQLTRISRRE